MSQKPKRVFNLKKRPSSKHGATTQPQQLMKQSIHSFTNDSPNPIISKIPQDSIISPKIQSTHLIDGPNLFIDTALLKFETLVDKVNTQTFKVTNTGTTSIYYQWIKITKNKINPSAILDLTQKFACLNDRNTIKPGEQIIFPFSFYSKIPGFFSEQYQFRCRPSLTNPFPLIKLQGNAYIIDKYQHKRAEMKESLNQDYIFKCFKEIIYDIVDDVKSPEEPPLDISQPLVAQKQFQRVNKSIGAIYNPVVFSWWIQLYKDIIKSKSPQCTNDWDLNLIQLKQLINTISDESAKYNHYLYLSKNPELNRSALYDSIYTMLGEVASNISGQYNDATRKQLQMWEVPWKYPQEQQNPIQKKARDDQIAKIKAQWLKKAKKKKWTEDDQKNLLTQYRNKMSIKTQDQILSYFDNYESKSQYIKTDRMLAKQPLTGRYFRFLQRLKSIQQVDIEGKKLLLKFQLQSHENTEAKIYQYKEFLQKKKQFQKKKQEEKKQLEKNKDKKKKTKNTVQLQEPKFDILDIVNPDSMNELVQIIRYIQQKSVKIVTLLINFGPRSVIPNPLYSLGFLRDYLRVIDPLIEFIPHQELQEVRLKVQDDNYSDGTILLLENCNFFSAEIGKTQEQNKVNELFAQQIIDQISILRYITDIYINDNKNQQFSGISSFIQRQSVLGLDWWKNIGICLKAQNSMMLIGGKLTPYKLQLIQRAMWYAKQITLVGEIGISFLMVKQNVQQYQGILLTKQQTKAIRNIDAKINQQWQPDIPSHKRTPIPRRAQITIPVDVVVGKKQSDWNNSQNVINIESLSQKKQQLADFDVIDIGVNTVEGLLKNMQPGRLFILQDIHINNSYIKSSQLVYKHLYKLKQARKIRHEEQQKKKGINYKADLIVIVVNNLQFLNKNLELVDKKIKKVKEVNYQEEGEQVYQQEEQEQEQQQQQEVKNQKKLENLPDFKLKYSEYPIRVLSGEFNAALSRITRYPRSQLD